MTYVWIKRRFKDFPVAIDQLEADPQASVTALISGMQGINGDFSKRFEDVLAVHLLSPFTTPSRFVTM